MSTLIDLKNMDEIALETAICEQEILLKQNPLLSKFLSVALQHYQEERERRMELLISESVGDPCSNTLHAREPSVTSKKPTTGEFETRGVRMRSKSTRYSDGEYCNEDEPTLTRCEKAQRETNRILRHQLRQNLNTIKQYATTYSCPLLRAESVASGTFVETNLRCLLSTQMKQVAVAGDGIEYDFDAIKSYIRKNVSRQLVSPVTKQPMNFRVHYVARGRDRDGKIQKRVETRVWIPDIVGDMSI